MLSRLEAEGLGATLGSTNLALALEKIVVYSEQWRQSTALDTTTVTRTKSASSDEGEMNVTASASFEPTDGQWVQCVRAAHNVVGLDPDVAADAGPLTDTAVQWQLRDPSATAFGICPAACIPTSAGLNLTTRTDSHGRSQAKVTGKRQPIDLTQRKPGKVGQRAALTYWYDLKDADPSRAVYWSQVLVDLVGIVGSKGNSGAGSALALGANYIMRHWGMTRINLFLQDWIPTLEVRWHATYAQDSHCGDSCGPYVTSYDAHEQFVYESATTLVATGSDATDYHGLGDGAITSPELVTKMVFKDDPAVNCDTGRESGHQTEELGGSASPTRQEVQASLSWTKVLTQLQSLDLFLSVTEGTAATTVTTVSTADCPGKTVTEGMAHFGDDLRNDLEKAVRSNDYGTWVTVSKWQFLDPRTSDGVLARAVIQGENAAHVIELVLV